MPVSEPQSISFTRHLRPLRLGFVVPPGDRVATLHSIQASTTLWGGQLNFILPDHRGDEPGGTRFAGMLSAFDPDFLVLAPGVPTVAGFPERWWCPLSEYLKPSRYSVPGGIDVMDVYQHIYEREFQFSRLHPREIVQPMADSPSNELLIAAACGSFPEGFDEYSQALHTLGADPLPTSRFNVFERDRQLTPIRLTLETISSRPVGAYYVVLDAESLEDLIAFWNLRARGEREHVVPLPLDGKEEWRPWLAEVLNRHASAPGGAPRPSMATLLRGPSVSEEAFATAIEKVEAPRYHCFVQHNATRPESTPAPMVPFAYGSPEVTGERGGAVLDERGGATLDALLPDFAPRLLGDAVFTNFVQPNGAYRTDLPEVFPAELGDLYELLRPVGGTGRAFGSQWGIRCICDATEIRFGRIPSGAEVMIQLFQKRGFQAELSSAGRNALELMRLLGSFGPGTLSPQTIRVLRRATDSPRGILHKEFKSALLRDTNNDHRATRNRLQRLLSAKALVFGQQVRCPLCEEARWHSLQSLGDRMVCPRCLSAFDYPAHAPDEAMPAYKTAGPFAMRGAGQGAYTVAHVFRFLRGLHGSARVTMSAGLDIHRGGTAFEVDVAGYWELSQFDVRESYLLIGECKTSGFSAADIAKVRSTAEALGPCVLILAWLENALDADAHKAVRDLAEWGRRENWRHPVILLTWAELRGVSGPFEGWRELNSEVAVRAATWLRFRVGLRDLADATQQIHLGMAPDAAWPESHR